MNYVDRISGFELLLYYWSKPADHSMLLFWYKAEFCLSVFYLECVFTIHRWDWNILCFLLDLKIKDKMDNI